MRTKKHKNPYFFDEVEDESLWKVNPKLIYFLIIAIVLAILAASLQQIKTEGQRKFPNHHENKVG